MRETIPGTDDRVTWSSALTNVVRALAAKRKRTPKLSRFPLWSMVGELTGNGSGYSAAICQACGLNADTGEALPAPPPAAPPESARGKVVGHAHYNETTGTLEVTWLPAPPPAAQEEHEFELIDGATPCPYCNHRDDEHAEYGRTVGCQAGDGSEKNPICGCRKLRGETSHEHGDPRDLHPNCKRCNKRRDEHGRQ